jgi:hypothetical protein
VSLPVAQALLARTTATRRSATLAGRRRVRQAPDAGGLVGVGMIGSFAITACDHRRTWRHKGRHDHQQYNASAQRAPSDRLEAWLDADAKVAPATSDKRSEGSLMARQK